MWNAKAEAEHKQKQMSQKTKARRTTEGARERGMRGGGCQEAREEVGSLWQKGKKKKEGMGSGKNNDARQGARKQGI